MNVHIANAVLAKLHLPPATQVDEVDVGFTNTVYLIDNALILKVCTDTKGNETPFHLESQLYTYFRNTLPIPQLITYDDSKTLLPYHYMLYPKIVGDNLYNVWHKMTQTERKDIVKQLCDLLKIINHTNLKSLPADVALQSMVSWRTATLGRLHHYLQVAERSQTLPPDILKQITVFIEQNADCLIEQKLALVYWDAHFDNVLVKNNQIVGLLDFERTEIASIDFVLDTVKRMVDIPKKYMSRHAEQFAKDEDYQDLLEWYRESYPELFAFKDLENRLKLYALAHDLKDLENWPIDPKQIVRIISQTPKN